MNRNFKNNFVMSTSVPLIGTELADVWLFDFPGEGGVSYEATKFKLLAGTAILFDFW